MLVLGLPPGPLVRLPAVHTTHPRLGNEGAPYTPYGYTVPMCWHQRPALRTEVIDA
jgi:hypothetical protein